MIVIGAAKKEGRNRLGRKSIEVPKYEGIGLGVWGGVWVCWGGGGPKRKESGGFYDEQTRGTSVIKESITASQEEFCDHKDKEGEKIM